MTFNELQKTLAIARVERAIEISQNRLANVRRNSFQGWGVFKVLSRQQETLEAMRQDRASDNQYRYWLNN